MIVADRSSFPRSTMEMPRLVPCPQSQHRARCLSGFARCHNCGKSSGAPPPGGGGSHRAGRRDRPRLRRPAAGGAVRHERVLRSWGWTSTRSRSSGSRRARATSATSPRSACAALRDVGPVRGHGRLRAARRGRRDRHLRADAAGRRTASPTSATSIATGRTIGRHLRPGPARGPREHDLSRARPATSLRPDARGGRPASPAATSSWPTAPSARTRATRSSRPRRSPRSSAAATRPSLRAGRGPLRRGGRPRSCPSRACEVAEACKILENTYRAVNIALVNELKLRLRPDGDRRLGGDRRGQDQAVRLPGVLPGPGPGRPLHPDRPVLPDLGGPQATGCTPGSSSWPARSTRRCPHYVVDRVVAALNDRGKPLQGEPRPGPRGRPTSPTSTTAARARRSS